MGTSTQTTMKLILATPVIVALASSTPLTRELTPSWVEACDGTYLFSEDKKTWSDAYGECELYGSHLVQIDGLAENFCLLKYIGIALMITWQKEFGNSTTVSSSCGLHGGHTSNPMVAPDRTVGSLL